MWVVVEYTDCDDNTCCWAVPEAWLDENRKLVYYPAKDFMKLRTTVTYPEPSWVMMDYDKILHKNIRKFIIITFLNKLLFLKCF